ncbi:MAG: hypothetical protein CMO81_06175 [Waddliaceae bacterium]|nr:hypothetical protein [Waddliaceae bacterium]
MVKTLGFILNESHCDEQSIPIPLKLLEFLEKGRWDAFSEHMLDLREKGLDLVIVNQDISFSAQPLAPGIHLEVRTSIDRFGNRTLVLLQEIWDPQKNQRYCSAKVTNCLAEKESGKAVFLTEELRDLFDSCSLFLCPK